MLFLNKILKLLHFKIERKTGGFLQTYLVVRYINRCLQSKYFIHDRFRWQKIATSSSKIKYSLVYYYNII